MRKLVLAAVSICMLVFALGAAAGPGTNGPTRTNGRGHWFSHVCAAPGKDAAMCDADVVTDSAGAPLATQSSPPPGAYGPEQLQTAYGLAGLASTQTIGIVDAYDDPNIASDLNTFDAQYGLPACTTANGCFTKLNQTGGTSYPRSNSGWALEISLDVETAHAICPGCRIVLVEASSSSMGNLGTAENEAVAKGANVVSNSWGGSESSSETTYDTRYFAHPGVAITASTGDDGYGVEYPAASPYVTAVGGTTLELNANNTWKSETAWSDGGSGCSAYEPKPAWQTDSKCSKRTLADVSADADPNTGAAVYDSVSYSGESGWFQVGGTSLSSPLVAAVYALTNGSHVNNGSTPYGAPTGSLHDVMSGSNGSCGGSYLCTAGPGYDGPTGLGTPVGDTAFTTGATASDFTVSVSPASAGVAQGSTATYTASVGSTGGSFGGTVSLSASGLPSGATASFDPTSTTAPGTSTLSVQTSSTLAPGTYPFTITGTSGTTHNVPATLVVTAAPAGDFAISVSPSSATIGRSSTTTYAVTVTPENGFTGAVTLSASGFVKGLTGSFSPNPTTGSSTFTVHASLSKKHTSVTLTITGTSGTLKHSTTLRLST